MRIATAIQSLMVNPAFLQEIKDSNPECWQTVDALESVCRTQGELDPVRRIRDLTHWLDALRDQLALQFSLEESYGYLEVPPQSAVRLPRRLCQLAGQRRTEHSNLYLRLSELAEQAEELQYRGVEPQGLATLVQQAAELLRDLRRHETAESELIRHGFDLG